MNTNRNVPTKLPRMFQTVSLLRRNRTDGRNRTRTRVAEKLTRRSKACDKCQSEMSVHLPTAQYVLNARFHSGIQNTPFHTMFGFTPRWNIDTDRRTNLAAGDLAEHCITARTHATQALTKAAELMKKFYDAKRDDQPPLPVGSKVWLENTNITPFRPMK